MNTLNFSSAAKEHTEHKACGFLLDGISLRSLSSLAARFRLYRRRRNEKSFPLVTRFLCWVLIALMTGAPNGALAWFCNDDCCCDKDDGNGEPACCSENNQNDSDNDPGTAEGHVVGSSKAERPIPQRGGRKRASLAFGRFYSSNMKTPDGAASYSGPLGVGVTHNYNILLSDFTNSVKVTTWNGTEKLFTLDGSTYNNASDGDTKLFKISSNFVWQLRDGTRYYFDAAHSNRLASIVDTVSNVVTLAYNANYQLTGATDSNGRSLAFGYDGNGRLHQVTDPINRTTTYSYDSLGQLTNETDAIGVKFSYTYDESQLGKVTRVTDANRHWLARYGYNDAGRVVADTNALGYVKWLSFDPVNRIATITNRNGYAYTDYFNEAQRMVRRDNWAGTKYYNRDDLNRITNIVDRLGNEWHYYFDASGCSCGIAGGMVMSVDPLGRVNQWSYETNFNLRTAFTNAAGRVTRWSYDDKGNLTNTTDALGNVTRYIYDTLGNRTQVIDALNHTNRFFHDQYGNLTNAMDALGNMTKFKYDLVGRLTERADALSRTNRFVYDDRDRITANYNGAGEWNLWEYDDYGNVMWSPYDLSDVFFGYDESHQLVSVSSPDAMTYTYDGNGNRTAVVNALGQATSYAYDGADRLAAITNALSKVWSFGYDAEGWRTSSTDPNSHTSLFGYDAAGQLTSMTNALNQTIQFQYDLVGNRTNIIDGRGNPLGFVYDAINRLTNIVYAASDKEAFQYDAVGNLTNYITRAGQAIRFTYDAANRLTKKEYVGAGDVYDFSYDAANELTQAVWRVSTTTNSIVRFQYDKAGRVINETQIIGSAPARSVGYAYRTGTLLRTLTYPDGSQLDYEFDDSGRFRYIFQGESTVVGYDYDSAGRRTQRTLENGTFTQYEYDASGQLTNLVHKRENESVISSFGYGYDDAGNRKWVKRANGKGDVYKYDAIDQLTNVLYEATNPDGTPSAWTNEARYVFDAAGNRTSVTLTNSGTTTYTANTLNQYTNVGGTTLSYDLNGNLTNHNGWSLTYDRENRLIQAKTGSVNITYKYDPFGRLVERIKGTTTNRYYYAGWQLIEERDRNDIMVGSYVYGTGIDEPLRRISYDDNYAMYVTNYYHADAQGNVTEITDVNGDLAGRYSYDVYGTPKVDEWEYTPNHLLFQGRDRDPDTGLYNFRYRYYSSSLGRFVQTDPVRHEQAWLNRNPLEEQGGPSLYSFVFNNPVISIDPYGLCKISITADPVIKARINLGTHYGVVSDGVEYGINSDGQGIFGGSLFNGGPPRKYRRPPEGKKTYPVTCNDSCECVDKCIKDYAANNTPPNYAGLGNNSNTYAHNMLEACGCTVDPIAIATPPQPTFIIPGLAPSPQYLTTTTITTTTPPGAVNWNYGR
jgi:RHS repeat-associated protein